MFRAVPCSSSGSQIVLLQHLISSLSVSGCTVRRLRADRVRSQPTRSEKHQIMNHSIQSRLPVEINECKSWDFTQRKTHKRKSVFIRILKVADIFGDCIEIKDKVAHW